MVDFAAPNPNSLLQLANSPLLPRFDGRRRHPRWRFMRKKLHAPAPSKLNFVFEGFLHARCTGHAEAAHPRLTARRYSPGIEFSPVCVEQFKQSPRA